MDGKEILEALCSFPKETEWVEFKEAKTSYDTNKIGKYFSALSNEACIHDRECAWLVFGVSDQRSIVGTNFRKHSFIEDLKFEVAESTTGRLTFSEIIELSMPEGRVLMFKIPPAPQGMPIAWKGHYYGRDGESLVPLNLHKMDLIRKLNHDWSSTVCEEATLGDLDLEAVEFARVEYVKKFPGLSAEAKHWEKETFLNKAKLCINGKLTNTAILLLGKEESARFLLPACAQMTWVIKDENNQELDYEHFGPPYILASQKVREKIRNLKYRYLPDGTLFPEEILKYDDWVIREALHNCIAHQDYLLKGKIVVVEKPDELIFSNMGTFIPGSVENVIKADAPPKQYRNAFLTSAMVNLNMIDTIGSGIKKMYLAQRNRFFPMPTYHIRSEEVSVKIFGKILNPVYTSLLRRLEGDVDLNTIIWLDYVQKGIAISREVHLFLKKQKLVEGRYPNLHLSSGVHDALGKKAEYIKKRGLDTDHYEKLVIEYLKKFGEVSRIDINDLLLDKLPDVLSYEQKINKINNLLYSMSHKKGLIIRKSLSRRYSVWTLAKPSF